MQLTSLTLAQAGEMISRHEISPVELVQAHLDRIGKLDAQLNSFITVTAEDALARAHRAEQEIMTGGMRSSLHGLPLALKDLFETEGVVTTAGSAFFKDYIPAEDCAAAHQLKQAGAILLGKLNMHEIALGVTNVNPHFGPCRNPWEPTRISGGSSGGSAAAVSAGLCLGALGTDTGGSIRIPAALCGVVGLKPTRGRISLRGVIPLSWNLDHVGPLARSVKDAAILLQALAGFDAEDVYSVDVPAEEYSAGLDGGVRGWRVAVAAGDFITSATDPEVLDALEGAVRMFSELGADVKQVEISELRAAALANGIMTTSDGAAYHRERLANNPELFGEDIRQRLQIGAAYSSTDYSLARQKQNQMRHYFAGFFENYEILITPTTPVCAPNIDAPDAIEAPRLLTRFTAPFNLTGLPAISLPCGFNSIGLPIGLQIISRAWGEGRALRAAQAFEQATDFHLRKPNLS